MNIERFKEDFSKFLYRCTTSCDNNNVSTVIPLTNQEILEAVQDVLNTKLDVTLVDALPDTVKTPASEIVVMTPDAPDIPKNNIEVNCMIPGRFRSLDTLTAESLKDTSVDQLIMHGSGSLTPKSEENSDVFDSTIADTLVVDKKGMSKSSPSVSTLVRSDTFVRENDENDPNSTFTNTDTSFNEHLTFKETKFDFTTTSGGSDVHSSQYARGIHIKLKHLRDSANELITKIDDIQKSMPNPTPEETRPIRRLSAIGGFPGLNRTSTSVRTIQRPKMTRRSVATAFPGTPTSSRLSPGNSRSKEVQSAQRRSTSTVSLVNIGGSSKLEIPVTYRSVSSGALLIPKKSPVDCASPSQISGLNEQKTPVIRSPALSLLPVKDKSSGRVTKNSKYAHVQSTIPKLGCALSKRKAN